MHSRGDDRSPPTFLRQLSVTIRFHRRYVEQRRCLFAFDFLKNRSVVQWSVKWAWQSWQWEFSNLCGDFRRTRDRASYSEDIRFNAKLQVILTWSRKVCSRRNESGKRHQSTCYCNMCADKPGIRFGNCFAVYRTKRQYRD